MSKEEKNFYRYIKSYGELSELALILSKDFYKYKKDLNNKGFKISDVVVTCTLRLFSKDKNLYLIRKKFLTNMYFLDAIKIKKMPNFDLIHKIEKSLNNQSNLAKKINKDFSSSLNLSKKNIKWKWFDNYITSFYKNKNKLNNSKLFGDKQKKLLDKNGYLIIPNVMSESLCNKLHKKIIELSKMEKQKKIAYIYGQSDNQRIYNLIGKDPIFSKLICNPLVIEVMDFLFQRKTLHDKYYLSSFHSNIISKQSEDEFFHIDAAVPEPIPKWIIRANVNFIIHDYTKENGATKCIPKSHKLAKIPSNEINFATKIKSMEAPKGSIVFWHGHLWHSSGSNNTQNSRIALLGCYAASFLREMSLEENHFSIISKNIKKSMSTKMKRLIGDFHGIKKGSISK